MLTVKRLNSEPVRIIRRKTAFSIKGYFIRKQTYDDYALFCSELDKLLSNRDVVIKRVE